MKIAVIINSRMHENKTPIFSNTKATVATFFVQNAAANRAASGILMTQVVIMIIQRTKVAILLLVTRSRREYRIRATPVVMKM